MRIELNDLPDHVLDWMVTWANEKIEEENSKLRSH